MVLTGEGYHNPSWSPSGDITAGVMLVTARALSQLRTGPHGGRLSQSKLVTQWCSPSQRNAGHRKGVITAQDWSSRGKVITIQAGHPEESTQLGGRRSPVGRYHSSGLVLTGEGYHSPSWSPSGVGSARITLDTGRALSQLRTGPHGGRLSQSELVTQWC